MLYVIKLLVTNWSAFFSSTTQQLLLP